MASDRLALDPTVSTDPQARLLARVAELEQQVSRIQNGGLTPTKVFSGGNGGGTTYSYTYTSAGGYVVILGFPAVIWGTSGGGGAGRAELVVNGTMRDFSQPGASVAGMVGAFLPTQPVVYTPGVAPSGTQYAITLQAVAPSSLAGGNMKLLVIELPFAG